MINDSACVNNAVLHPLGMKYISLFSLLLFAVCMNGFAQTKGNAKLYGYVQSVSGGASPERSEGPTVATNSGTNYYIYLTSQSSSRIYPSELWINGERYGVQMKTIAETPVLFESADPALNNKTLVPKTKQKVIQLVPITANGVKKSAKGEALSKTNGVVAVYKLNGKFYYATLKELSRLENAALQ
jgi:hypothetical protein